MVSMEQTVHSQSMRYKRISAAKAKDVNVWECVYDESGIKKKPKNLSKNITGSWWRHEIPLERELLALVYLIEFEW